MAISEQELKNFNFSAGMNTELGLVNTDEKTAKNLENVELGPDGSAERRSGLAFFDPTLKDSDPMDITGQRSQAGWQYPATSAQMLRLVHDNKVKDFLAVSGANEDVAGPYPSITVKELTNGVADLEDWSTDSGTELNGLSSTDTVPVFKTRYCEIGEMFLALNPSHRVACYTDPTSVTVKSLDPNIRDPQSNIVDSFVSNNSIAYQCITSHTSGSGTEPGVGAGWPSVWRRVGGAGSEPAWVTATGYTSNIKSVWAVVDGGVLEDGAYFTHATFLGGRVWYSGCKKAPSTVYVTQPVSYQVNDSETTAQLEFCFSFNDPNSPTDSSPTAADGGSIELREAGLILATTEFREGLLMFTTKGVWAIPNAGNFNATNFDVLKISDVPCAGPDAVVKTDFGVVYFGVNSVQIVTITDNGNMVAQEISTPIRTFYNSISEFSKETSFTVYNKSEQRIYWFTTFTEPTYTTGNGPYRTVNYNAQPCAAQDILLFDFKLKAWYKYQMRKDQTITDDDLMIADAFTIIGDFGEEPTVINLAGDELQNAALDDIVASGFDGTNIQEFTVLLLTGKKTILINNDVFRYGFAHLSGDLTQDFDNLPATDDALKSTFDSEILSQHMNFTDIGHNKTAPYIHTIFRRVESGILDEGGIDITPGGCNLQFRWNWSTGTKAGPQFGTAFQAYKPGRWNIQPGDGSLPDIEVVLNRHKVQGRGRALQLRYSNDGTKRFHLLGYQLEVEATKKV